MLGQWKNNAKYYLYLWQYRISKNWKVTLLLVIGFLLFSLVGGGMLIYTSWNLPRVESLKEYQPSLATKVYSDDDQLIGQFYIEKRILIPLKEIPLHLINAVIAVEDARFYRHGALDYLGIARAFWANLWAMEIKQGGSTITQQLARTLFLTPERSLTRKLKEALLSIRIERVLSKDEILELYLNQIYFGNGAYGIQAAAQTYFGKDVKDLSLAEAAILAGLPRAPEEYSPYKNPERAKTRQGVVLKRMVEEGFITQEQYAKAYEEDIYLVNMESIGDVALYFLEYIRQYLINTYGADMLYKGGLNVHTTLNMDMQRSAHKAVKEGLRALDKRQGYRGPIGRKAIEKAKGVAIEEGYLHPGDMGTKEGDILDGTVVELTPKYALVSAGPLKGKIFIEDMAWATKKVSGDTAGDSPSDILQVGDVVKVKVKGFDKRTQDAFFTLEQEPLVEGALLAMEPPTGHIKVMVGGYDFKRSEFNRTLQARRQPGSAFKPIVYATALEEGYTPSSIVVDAPVVYEDPELQKVWKPQNFEEKFYGPITLRTALTFSRNLATIRLIEQIGPSKVISFANRLGILSPLANNLSLGLGSSSVTLKELMTAYNVYANQGVRVEPLGIRYITGNSGNILEQNEPREENVLPLEIAFIITNMMENVIQEGTGQRAKVLGRPTAGKTGTTNEFIDAWFIGYTPNLIAGAWVGFDDRRSLGNGETGSRAALPIWVSFMKEALNKVPSLDFPVPEDIIYAKVDPKSGFLANSEVQNPIIEVFKKGTEPKEYAVIQQLTPIQFFKLDENPD